MLSIDDWRKYFPFNDIRKEQEESINFILNSFLIDNKKYCLCELGTGTGKSAIAITVSRYMQANNPATTGSWFLTTQKILQDQYIKDFGTGSRPIKTIKSSNSYVCNLFDLSDVKMSCAEVTKLKKTHSFFKKMYCHCDESCRYKKEKQQFLDSLNSLTNYSYFFVSSSNEFSLFTPRNLLILDECHTIEEQLSKHIETVVNENFSKNRLNCSVPKSITNIDKAILWIKKKYIPAVDAKRNILKTHIKECKKTNANQSDGSAIAEITKLIKQFELISSHLTKIKNFVLQYEPENWVLNIDIVPGKNNKSHRRFVFKPIDVSSYATNKLFNYGKHVLLLSATIIDKNSYCESLGISQGSYSYKRIDSPFDVTNRPIHILSIGSMSRRNLDETLPRLKEAVELLLSSHLKEKGIIHCTNYKIAKFLFENINSPRLLIHDSFNREATITKHCQSVEPTVLLSPSMTEGLDLSGDKSRFQIICKIPFPYLGDKVVKQKMKNNNSWYDSKTIKTIIQAVGRSVRNVDDYATTYVLDSDWNYFYDRSQHMFPKDFIDSIQK